MSFAVLHSRALLGIDARQVVVEIHLSNGLPGFALVGLPETAVRESKERVRSAILNSGLEFPSRRITVNLAPADLPKAGGQYDLAIALGILGASGQLDLSVLHETEILGELALDGAVRQVPGTLAAALAAKRLGRSLLAPRANGAELNLASNASIRQVDSLLEVVDMLCDGGRLSGPVPGGTVHCPDEDATLRRSETAAFHRVLGQPLGVRAVTVAAAGNHNLLMVGPPGCGKSMLAHNGTLLLPPLAESDAMEVACIHSLMRTLPSAASLYAPPLRSPHHSATSVALTGGGLQAMPGEVSLAHQGVLFLDEFAEFKPSVLDSLREPMETGEIGITRANYRVTYPARFQLLAAMNPCACGYRSDPRRSCRCSDQQLQHYQKKLSGPLLDRIDLQVELPSLSSAELFDAVPDADDSESAWQRRKSQVADCRALQMARSGKLNSRLSAAEVEQLCRLSAAQRRQLGAMMDQLGLSARALHRIQRVARTLADLDASAQIKEAHLMEAVALRRLEFLERPH